MHRQRDRNGHLLDLVFLAGVAAKALDGLAELAGGLPLIFLVPGSVFAIVHRFTTGELLEDPHDLLANLLANGVAHLSAADLRFTAVYLTIHGLVKVAIVIALIAGATKVYPWALAALASLTIFQIIEFAIHPTIGLAVLSVVDIVIIALTWREWRSQRSLRMTARDTWHWLRRRSSTA